MWLDKLNQTSCNRGSCLVNYRQVFLSYVQYFSLIFVGLYVIIKHLIEHKIAAKALSTAPPPLSSVFSVSCHYIVRSVEQFQLLWRCISGRMWYRHLGGTDNRDYVVCTVLRHLPAAHLPYIVKVFVNDLAQYSIPIFSGLFFLQFN